MSFQKVDINKLPFNPFEMIGNEWTLITAEKDGVVNTMTASWGTTGVFWGKNVIQVGIRPQRYTKEFVDAANVFTVSFFGGDYKKELGYLGSVSGRDEDKIAKVDFHVANVEEGAPSFEEAKLVLVCKPLMVTNLDPANFKDAEIDEKWYANKDYHVMYTAEIISAYCK
ncbi:MAG: flavin reductase [Eubacteriales bacterium]|nr:flavin reductase [Eubacteriales bacterium]